MLLLVTLFLWDDLNSSKKVSAAENISLKTCQQNSVHPLSLCSACSAILFSSGSAPQKFQGKQKVQGTVTCFTKLVLIQKLCDVSVLSVTTDRRMMVMYLIFITMFPTAIDKSV